jgi:hypothetical protein
MLYPFAPDIIIATTFLHFAGILADYLDLDIFQNIESHN